MDVQVNASQTNPDVNIVVLAGRFDIVASETVSPAMTDALDRSKAGIIMDLEGVNFISSAGLRVVLAVRKKADTDGKKMAVIRALPPVYKIFKIAALDKVFQFFEGEEEAIQAVWS